MVLTDPSDPSRARHRPGLHCELAAIAPGADLHVRSRRVTTSIVPLGLSSELCPSSNLLGRSGWVRKSSTAARYTLSANFRSEQMKANRLVRRLQPKVPRKQHQFTERNTGLQNTTGSSWPHLRTTVRSIRQSAVSGRAPSSFTSVGGNTWRIDHHCTPAQNHRTTPPASLEPPDNSSE